MRKLIASSYSLQMKAGRTADHCRLTTPAEHPIGNQGDKEVEAQWNITDD